MSIAIEMESQAPQQKSVTYQVQIAGQDYLALRDLAGKAPDIRAQIYLAVLNHLYNGGLRCPHHGNVCAHGGTN